MFVGGGGGKMIRKTKGVWHDKPWPYYLIIAFFALLIIIFAVDWEGVFGWWSGEGKSKSPPHESLRNLGLMLAGFVGVGLATWRSIVAGKQAKTAEQGLITDRFTKAIEQLGNENVSVRIGGLYALKRIAVDSPEQDLDAVLDVISNFVRHPPYEDEQKKCKKLFDSDKMDFIDNHRQIDCPDVIVAIGVLQSRSDKQKQIETFEGYRLTLERARLSFMNLVGVDLSGFIMESAQLIGADLNGSILNNVYFFEADLECVNLNWAKLDNAIFDFANLCGADLSYTVVFDAKFHYSNLTATNMKGVRGLNKDQLEDAWCENDDQPVFSASFEGFMEGFRLNPLHNRLKKTHIAYKKRH